MDWVDWLKCVIAGLVIVIVCAFITTFFLPKPHQGYYMSVRDGSNGNQIYPVYRIYNNWKWFPDELAYESLSAAECIEMYLKLRRQ